ncbi:antibiotic biosynthesis monooxygenase family protein [Rhodococcoides fascians]|uniref:antibiotic biosynthesis monooxygenase family protein n=1 Tax=Rhodococcoides fascians TaxID=1828 RepID=UPI00055DBAE1|nr:antibiotic biosynthesis monooxygenase family protein [Rhodococcus fascians]
MIRLRDLDESIPFFAQLKNAGTGPVTVINTFVFPTGARDDVLAVWKKDSDVMKASKGFISAQLHEGVAGSSTLINVAVWESAEDLFNAFTSPQFQALLTEYPDGSTAYPVLARKVAVQNICVA